MSEKRKPTHCLDSFKEEFSDENNLNFTRTAILSAFALGFGRSEIVEVIQTMQKEHFYKSMTSHANHKIWQDVYHFRHRDRIQLSNALVQGEGQWINLAVP